MSMVKEIARDLRVRTLWVERVISRAPYTYKTYHIPKKRGGSREISQPARETKLLQYWVMEKVLSSMPVHTSAVAYVEGKNIKANADLHKNNPYLAKFDVASFFPSIKLGNVVQFFSDKTEFSDEEVRLFCRILLRKRKHEDTPFLSIGAPSSPMLSNILMHDFDQDLADFCSARGIVYSRYADDMTFSTRQKGVLFELSELLPTLLSKYPYGEFLVNSDKTIYLSKRNSRRVTGLLITNDERISLGRERKRNISSMIHHFSLAQLDLASTLRLKGLLAFAKDVEPLFVARMQRKYGSETIRNIMSTQTLSE